MAKQSSLNLFPILPSIGQNYTGIARLAAEAPHAGSGHLIEFRALNVRSVLNRTVSRRGLPFAYSINPYRGCEFACRYCYARYTHEFMELRDPASFERIIFLKKNAAWLLQQELRHIDPAQEIALGSATDPYQPIERRARITRSLLEVFSAHSGYRLGIVTKSTLIARDIDLLQQIARSNALTIHITITTQNTALARKLEPRAPRPDLRFATVTRLRAAGLRVGILCCPLLPGITDSEEALDGMARRAAAHGACFFSANPLFLKPCSRPTFLSFVREHYPSLVADYDKRYGHADFVSPGYRNEIATRVARICRRYNLGRRSVGEMMTTPPQPAAALPFKTEMPPRKPPASTAGPLQRALFA